MKKAREPGYTPFSDAPAFEDEETPLPVSIPSEELQHLTEDHDTASLEPREATLSAFSTLMRFVWQGGSPGDAWLHMTAAQVLQMLGKLLYRLCSSNMPHAPQQGLASTMTQGMPTWFCMHAA